MCSKIFKLTILLIFVSPTLALTPCGTCPSDGIFSNWKDATSCTQSCGLYGKKVQTRTCVSWKYGCPCNGPLSRTVPCPSSLCQFPDKTCAAGYRKLQNEKNGDWYCGNVSLPTDDETPSCQLTKVIDHCPCPSGGIWSSWATSTPCSASCGLCGMVKQTRTCRSTKYGCKCSGLSTRMINCPAAPCPGNKCCRNRPVVRNLRTKKNQCGLQPPAELVVALPSCSITTTTRKPTTKPTTKKTTERTTTKKPITTTKAPGGCVSHPEIKYANCAAVGNGFKDVGGSCYKVIVVRGNRQTARQGCKAEHADSDLGTIRCKAENQGAWDMAQEASEFFCDDYYTTGDHYSDQMWIGLNNENDPNGVSWLNGANSTYRNWAPNEPNNGDLQGAEPSTQMFIKYPNVEGMVSGEWNDFPPTGVTCAALCEVLTRTSGKKCGQLPC